MIELDDGKVPVEQQDMTKPPLAPGQSIQPEKIEVGEPAMMGEIIVPSQNETLPQGMPLTQVYEADVKVLEDIKEGKKLVVDAHLYHKLVYSMMMGHPEIYVFQSGLKQFGLIRGGETLEDWKTIWEETKKYMQERQT